MAENTHSSAFVAVVGRLAELSESELRQLHLIVGVRLGFPAAPSSVAPSVQRNAGRKTGGGGKSAKAGKAGKGNPQRKSQWANHPLYQRYASLKKRVEAQAKEAKTSFNSVNTAESREYREALSQWLEAKSSFRGRGEATEDNSDEESEEEAGPVKAGPANRGTAAESAAPPAAPRAAASPPHAKRATPKESPPKAEASATGGSPPVAGKGKAPAK